MAVMHDACYPGCAHSDAFTDRTQMDTPDVKESETVTIQVLVRVCTAVCVEYGLQYGTRWASPSCDVIRYF